MEHAKRIFKKEVRNFKLLVDNPLFGDYSGYLFSNIRSLYKQLRDEVQEILNNGIQRTRQTGDGRHNTKVALS